MDLQTIIRRLPIVYTTRLDDMKIFRKDLSKTKLLDVIESIIAESKPIYDVSDLTRNPRLSNIKQEYDKDSICYQHINDSLNKRQHWHRFETLKAKVEHMKNKSQCTNSETDVEIKCEIGTNVDNDQNKIESLLALCKPLKIVLKDINKTVPKTNDEIKMEVLCISSDSDDDVIAVEENKTIENNRPCPPKKNATSTHKSIDLEPIGNYVIKSINEFNVILLKEDIKNSVIVIYNLYLKELDAYQIGERYNVTEYKTRKYIELYRFPMKKCKIIVNIIACCWSNRQTYVSLLMRYRQYNDIVKYMNSTHPCGKSCTCCCFYVEQSSKAQDGVNNTRCITGRDVKTATLNQNSKFIDLALKFQKNTKWKGYPAEICDLDDKYKSNYKSCHTLLQLNNTKRVSEFYELGRENEIYSKLIKNEIDDSCWLTKTLGRPQRRLYYTFTDPADRDKQIVSYKHMTNVISFNTECFLRMPKPLSMNTVRQCNRSSDPLISYKIRHERSFKGASNKKSKVLSILSAIRKNKVPVRSEAPPVPSTKHSDSVPTDHHQSTPRSLLQPRQSVVMEQDASQTVNCLIKGILHRFSNVHLTINSEGKVAAALNSQLNSLTASELKILSQILNHAQSQVDKLGLTPGTCLNPDSPMINNSTTQNNSTSSIDVAYSENSVRQKSQTVKNQRKVPDTKSKNLSNFSKIIAQRKVDYQKSFRSYLLDTIGTIPKITNVFSLNYTNHALPDNFNSPLEGINVTNEINNDLSMRTDPEIGPNTLPNTYTNKIKDKLTIVDNEIEYMRSKERKRKTSLECNSKPPKIRVKTTAEIVNNDLVETPLVPLTLENPYPIQSDL